MRTQHCQGIGFLLKIVALAVITVISPVAEAGDQLPSLNEVRDRLPEKITPLTNEQLTNSVPKSYFFRYRAQPQPGTRKWKRIDANTWHEIYPDGGISVFRVLGRSTVNGMNGTIVINVGNGSPDVFFSKTGQLRLQAFIPDKGSKKMRHYYRNTARGDQEWNDLAPMRNIK